MDRWDLDPTGRSFLMTLEREVASLSVREISEPHRSFENLFGHSGKRRKHRLQESQLLAQVPDTVLETVTDFVELGAGQGDLSLHMARLVTPRAERTFHLLDRQTFRSNSRRDGQIRAMGNSVSRVTRSVEGYAFEEVRRNEPQSVLVTAKHLCGSATDAALFAFSQFRRQGLESGKDQVRLALAPCCHGLVVEDLFFGNAKELREDRGLPVPLLAKAAAWATLKIEDAEDADRMRRRQLGVAAKSILNASRCQNLGSDASIVRYTRESVECEVLLLL